MSNNKQSSLDFLLKELEEIGVLNIKNCHWSDEVDVKKAIEQAKAMHKEESVDFALYTMMAESFNDLPEATKKQLREAIEVKYKEYYKL